MKTKKFKFFEVCSFMHSILVWGSNGTNSSISEVWKLVCIVGSTIFLLKISHRFHMEFRSGMLAFQSSTVVSWSANNLEVVLVLWAGAKVLTLDALTPASVHSLWKSLLLVHLFLPNFILPVNFAFNMLWYSTLWTAPPFSNDPLWLTLFVEGVNDRLLDHF